MFALTEARILSLFAESAFTNLFSYTFFLCKLCLFFYTRLFISRAQIVPAEWLD